MDWRDYIESDPAILGGKPVIRGTRLSVELIVGWLDQGWTGEMVVEAYPLLSRADVEAVVAFRADDSLRKS